MERSSAEKRLGLYDAYDGFKSFISTFLGVIVAILGIIVVFVISSLEGTKEIKASNKENAILLSMWREQTGLEMPENNISIVKYNDKEYYFVVEEFSEEGAILKWYFAYDGGLEYIFGDYKFYILTSITIVIAVFVSQINYTTSINGTMGTTKFLKTLSSYQDTKKKIAKFSQYIPMYCTYKNEQLYEEAKRELVESANISYDFYLSDRFDYDSIEDWQKKILKRIKKIKIDRISTSDLLQEKKFKGNNKSMLPIAPEQHQRKFLLKSFVQRTASSALSGMTMAFGIMLGNWVLGVTYGFTVLISFIAANIIGSDYANNGLRQRFIAKTDLLNEFNNMVDYFIAKDSEIATREEKQEVSVPFGEGITIAKFVQEEKSVVEPTPQAV